MSEGLNQCTLLGSLGRDPELRYTTSGLAVLNFTIACDERYRDRQTGEWKTRTEWVPVTVFGARAEGLARILRKGSRCCVVGSFTTTKSDGRDGVTRYYSSIRADSVLLAGGKRAAEGDQSEQPETTEPSDDGLPF